MPDRTHTKQSRDINQLAVFIMDVATGLVDEGCALLRTEARTCEALEGAKTRAIDVVTTSDDAGFVRHCAYQAQSL